MSERRRGLGRGLGALIPSGPPQPAQDRPRDVFFPRAEDRSEKEDPPAREHAAEDAPGGDGAAEESPRAEGFTESESQRAEGSTESERTRVSGGDSRGLSGEVAGRASDPDPGAPAVEAATESSGDRAPAPGRGGGTEALRQVPGASFAEIAVEDIRPNPRQPREVFDEEELAELVHSITELGVLQPIVVRRSASAGPASSGRTLGDLLHSDQEPDAGPAYELVMGERRLRAAKAAGLDAIPAIVRDTDDDHMLRDALLENLHRAQLNPLEEAAAYQQLLEDFSCTHDELASRLGRSRPQVSNMIRLLKLPPMVQRRVASGVLSAGHARALLGLSDGAAMERLAQRIVAEGLSVRSVEEIVLVGSEEGAQPRRAARRQAPSAELQDVAHRLSERFETRVQVSQGRRKGRITVEFAGQEDLERIVAVLTGE